MNGLTNLLYFEFNPEIDEHNEILKCIVKGIQLEYTVFDIFMINSVIYMSKLQYFSSK